MTISRTGTKRRVKSFLEFDQFLVFGGFIDGQNDFDGFTGFATVDPEFFAALQRIEKSLEIPRVIFVGDGQFMKSNFEYIQNLAERLLGFGNYH